MGKTAGKAAAAHGFVDPAGAFEGANYEATGYYRPQIQCLMFTRSEAFCHVCADAVSTIIDLYSAPAVVD